MSALCDSLTQIANLGKPGGTVPSLCKDPQCIFGEWQLCAKIWNNLLIWRSQRLQRLFRSLVDFTKAFSPQYCSHLSVPLRVCACSCALVCLYVCVWANILVHVEPVVVLSSF